MGFRSALHRTEEWITAGSLILLAAVPVAEIITRLVFHTGIPASALYMSHLVLWVACFGAMITSREGRHLSLSLGFDKLKEPWPTIQSILSVLVTSAAASAMALSSLSYSLTGFDPDARLLFIPLWIFTLPLPIAFAVIAVRSSRKGSLLTHGVAAIGMVFGILAGIPSLVDILWTFNLPVSDALQNLVAVLTGALSFLTLPGCILIVVSAVFGTPIFIVLGSVALLLINQSGGVISVIPNEAYTLLTGTNIAAIPLFTFAGFILSESDAGKRLLRLFRAFFGWMPGGIAIVAVLVSTFFTTFTGATGVTILALGALLLFALEQGGYPKPFSTGLLTASGSIGLLFPPSLPIILYGVIAQVNIRDLFIAGLIPGLLLVVALSVFGVWRAVRSRIPRVAFSLREGGAALADAWGEILLPIVILAGYFGGFTTLTETGAVAVIYVLVVQVLIRRDLNLTGVLKAIRTSIPVLGGVLAVLALSRGLSYYIIDAEVPAMLASWVGTHIQSRFLFLIMLNIVLLLTGCFMDIFSAIMVVVPLILPLGELFGIHPIHLGIIFLANLGLGYLTPPVGLNLFLASYRFGIPLHDLYRQIIPFFLALLGVVLLITYVPGITLLFVTP